MKSLEKILDAVMRFLMAFSMFILVAFGTWQIFSRWVLKDPSTFTDELLRYVLIIAGMIGSAYCFYRDEHLALTLISDKAKGLFKSREITRTQAETKTSAIRGEQPWTI